MIVDVNELDRELAVRSITASERELFGRGAWSESSVRQELDAPARFYFADVDEDADADGRSVIRGYAGFWYDGDDAEIMTIGVGKAYQRQGIAAALLQRLIDEARAQGAARMLLEVRVDNDPALALYERFGFQRLGLRKRYYQPEGIDAYTMSLDVAGPRIVGFQSGHAAA
ncbi:ribosomal protein S18-alanine N-acetyltransferase [Bifidobacterium sp. 64T4]|uniref:ribosomal protein S18-alanine N-acetyltransferase n=1 Tax=Bifidobacterium pongonis TaxID=2834432 RepID=UPI001C57D0E7|nr:ribosomal protein S18-alanine N-acetyltransferase [Bifidobacterium pongonis]MBW3094054.1 ribosomal protein S18-alanine N-acetyltransferase [Bifidobacterium pongonis]